jgi:hypothetical protein
MNDDKHKAAWFAVASIGASIYNLALLGGCAYLVHNGWSAWWFLLAIAACKSISTCDAKEVV